MLSIDGRVLQLLKEETGDTWSVILALRHQYLFTSHCFCAVLPLFGARVWSKARQGLAYQHASVSTHCHVCCISSVLKTNEPQRCRANFFVVTFPLSAVGADANQRGQEGSGEEQALGFPKPGLYGHSAFKASNAWILYGRFPCRIVGMDLREACWLD